MREILFRGKRVFSQKFVEGSLIRYGEYCCILPQEGVLHPMDEPYLDPEYGTFDGKADPVDPETVGQFTGLKDKNGKRIFEGDLLRLPPKDEWEKSNFAAFEVFWHDNDACDQHIGWQIDLLHFQGALCGLDYYPIRFIPKWANRMEIIGNIYDNPELIGGAK